MCQLPNGQTKLSTDPQLAQLLLQLVFESTNNSVMQGVNDH